MDASKLAIYPVGAGGRAAVPVGGRGIMRAPEVPMLVLTLSLALAAEPRLACGELGPMAYTVEGDGVVGNAGRFALSGSVAAAAAGGWRGALADLRPVDVAGVDPAAVAKAFAAVGPVKARGAKVKGKGVKGEVGADGVLRGTYKGDSYAWALDRLGAVFGGAVPPNAKLPRLPRTLAKGDPFAKVGSTEAWASLARVVEAFAREAGEPVECGAGGSRLWLDGWASPVDLPAGTSVVWVDGAEALTRSAAGVAWHLVTGLPEADARALAPEAKVARQGALAWITASAPLASISPALLPLLSPDPSVLAPDAPPTVPDGLADPIHAGGLEMVRLVNAARRAQGLGALAIDPALTWASLSQCLYLDANPAARGSRQERSDRLYFGENPDDRGGADELAARGGTPAEVVAGWLAGPQARSLLLHPAAQRIGACATAQGGRVIDVSIAHKAKWTPFSSPPPRSVGAPLRASSADPLVVATAPRGGAVGGPVTLWVAAPAGSVQVLSARLDASGVAVPAYVIPPGESRGLGGEAVIHLVPKGPLTPGRTYEWTIDYTVNGADGRAEGSFTAAEDPGSTPVRLEGTAARVLARANARRYDTNGTEPLRPTAAADMAARVYVAGRRSGDARRLVDATVGWYCAPAGTLEAWVGGKADATLDPLILDGRFTRFGAAQAGGELCLVLAGEPTG